MIDQHEQSAPTLILPSAPLAELPGLGPVRLKALERLGLGTVEDLLTHYPRRYEDRRQFERFPNAAGDRPVCVCGIVVAAATKRLGGRRFMTEVTLQETERHALSSLLVLRWFNAFYVQKIFASGQRVVVFGKPKAQGKRIVLDHPEYEIIEDDADSLIHLRRITPVYPATEGLSQRVLRGIIFRALAAVDLAALSTPLPAGLDPLTRGAALRGIHFPSDEPEREAARRHLVLSEFFGLQLIIAGRRARTVSRPGHALNPPGRLLERFLAALPFALTGAQTRAIGEIRADLALPRPMNRLLQGDVGAGKTFVALAAMLLAVESGFQAALMAPTQILAEQHYLVFRRWLEPLGLRLSLRTGNRRADAGVPDLFGIAAPQSASADPQSAAAAPQNGIAAPQSAAVTPQSAAVTPQSAAVTPQSAAATPQSAAVTPQSAAVPPWPSAAGLPDIFIGTHALLYEKDPPPRLGLAIVDEQHKFGVLQRAALSKGTATPPDVLVMTATPIPRTLAITVYGDLDVSILDELPAGRGKIITAVRPDSKLPEAANFIRAQLAAGRQAYLVYPLIEESEKLEAKAAAARFEHWKEVLKPFRCELLHGRLRPEEKDTVMAAFRDGQVHALVSTTVIEVGIDVKNANLMLIENAERFGLAQLHQLRGRIGRGEHKSYCLLMVDARASAEAVEKLGVLEKSADGFVVAEADLKLRGPGDILGTAQSGLPPLKLGDIVADAELMRLARAAAKELFEDDPRLEKPANARFREFLRASRKLLLAQVS